MSATAMRIGDARLFRTIVENSYLPVRARVHAVQSNQHKAPQANPNKRPRFKCKNTRRRRRPQQQRAHRVATALFTHPSSDSCEPSTRYSTATLGSAPRNTRNFCDEPRPLTHVANNSGTRGPSPNAIHAHACVHSSEQDPQMHAQWACTRKHTHTHAHTHTARPRAPRRGTPLARPPSQQSCPPCTRLPCPRAASGTRSHSASSPVGGTRAREDDTRALTCAGEIVRRGGGGRGCHTNACTFAHTSTHTYTQTNAHARTHTHTHTQGARTPGGRQWARARVPCSA